PANRGGEKDERGRSSTERGSAWRQLPQLHVTPRDRPAASRSVNGLTAADEAGKRCSPDRQQPQFGHRHRGESMVRSEIFREFFSLAAGPAPLNPWFLGSRESRTT